MMWDRHTLTLTENLYFPLTGAAHCKGIFKIGGQLLFQLGFSKIAKRIYFIPFRSVFTEVCHEDQYGFRIHLAHLSGKVNSAFFTEVNIEK